MNRPDGPMRDPGPPPEAGAPGAAQTLRDLEAISTRSRRAATTALTGIPLLAWGIAWMIGFTLLATQPWRIAVPIGLVLAAAAAATTWLIRSRQVRSGREGRVGGGWLAVMACSPFLVAVISPVDARVEVIFLGSLWGLALLVLAIATRDLPLGLVGALVIVAAAVGRVSGLDQAVLVFGLVGGAAMATLGGWRVWRAR